MRAKRQYAESARARAKLPAPWELAAPIQNRIAHVIYPAPTGLSVGLYFSNIDGAIQDIEFALARIRGYVEAARAPVKPTTKPRRKKK